MGYDLWAFRPSPSISMYERTFLSIKLLKNSTKYRATTVRTAYTTCIIRLLLTAHKLTTYAGLPARL